MRMGQLDRFQKLGVLLEELGIGAQEPGEIVGVHGSFISSVPS
jgi:hypothetical protein